MACRTYRRRAWAAGLSLVLHGLVLTGMVLSLRVLAPPPDGRALDLRLVALPELRSRIEPVHPPPARAAAAAPPPRRPAPQRPAAAPAVVLPGTPAPAPRSSAGRQADGGPKGLLPGFRERLGCDDPAAFHLTAEQRRACADELGRLARNARPLALNIPDAKRGEYDNYVDCLRLQQTVPVPSMDPNDPSSGAEVLPGGVILNQGLGNVPVRCWMGHW